MHRIHPVCEETVSPHVGRPVCLVMRDGTHMYGTLGGCRDGKVYLNECFQGPRLSSVQSKQQLRRVSKKKLSSARKAKSSAYGGYPYGGGYGGYGGYGYGAGYDVALIATLFLLPFLFI
ncbi:hypothetical protein NKT34_25025 [Paenibacillus polysaccharolyticus]|uniref:Uncharacterized protein n=2 Tax=Paenibacillus TaxID=44249 RepID=A0A1G5LNU1_9BACL|nr:MULTISPECIES: hypothetical protein [Paenibacillus]MBY0203619.1 hypothetical protein [Paenibacillus cucumis (ex Kampfer et al. 2016)]MCP1136553.1 hypothetical protein [Paenibacillus polysaccharolyticus]MDP9702806.1 hypothetical protein [Paenibacillus intestini]SCZ14575.1 hypothetical protein SAMN05720606_1336 [Paenibacillus polysaccharolyticus]